MLKRILIYCAILVGSFSLVLGYFWFKQRQVTAAAARELEPIVAEMAAERDALESLGDVDLDPAELTFAELEKRLHQPVLKRPGEKGTTKLGWACAKEHCVIWVWFPVPVDREVRAATAPIGLAITDFLSTSSHRLAIGGIYLGETTEEMLNSCRARGYGISLGRNRINWDKDWNLVWAGTDGKIHALVFSQERKIKNLETKRFDASRLSASKKGEQ